MGTITFFSILLKFVKHVTNDHILDKFNNGWISKFKLPIYYYFSHFKSIIRPCT